MCCQDVALFVFRDCENATKTTSLFHTTTMHCLAIISLTVPGSGITQHPHRNVVPIWQGCTAQSSSESPFR
jgi:hypothetical protein